MKRFVSLLLCAALFLTPAAAASPSHTTDQRLTEVTQSVKATLGLDNRFSSFSGTLREDALRPLWDLTWEAPDGSSLDVTAGEDGTIYRYWYTPAEVPDLTQSPLPALPAVSRETAQQTALDFAGRVLGPNERCDLSQDRHSVAPLSADHRFSGTLYRYDLPTPIHLSFSVDPATGQLLSFSRSDGDIAYTGTPIDPKTLGLSADRTQNASAYDSAARQLTEPLSLRLEYKMDANTQTASLHYLPVETDSYYVDARTGKRVNLTEQMEHASETMGGRAENAAAADAGGSLSEAEQAGIAQMEGVLSRDALDGKVRAYAALGLSGWTLSECRYAIDDTDGTVCATLRYTQDTADDFRSRWVTVDAKAGTIESVTGSTSWLDADEKPAIPLDTAQKTAEAFVRQLWPEQFASCALYGSHKTEPDGPACHRFVFSQQVNGYFFPENHITVSVDAQDGAVTGLNRDFDAQPAFDSPDGIIPEAQARAAWLDTFETRLGYLAVPDASAAQAAELGYPSAGSLALAFYLEQPAPMQGIDAKSAQPIPWDEPDSRIPAYPDLSSSWAADRAQTLANAGIGWLGGALQPTKSLTQLDLLALVYSVEREAVDPSDADAADNVYAYAFHTGFLSRADRDDDKPVSRGELVQTLLDFGGYGAAARIPGIYRCTFSDADTIPQAYYGYAAIAQGLSMVTGDESGRFAAGQTATREEAISMLYQLLARA